MKVTGIQGSEEIIVLSIKLDDDGEPIIVDQDGIQILGFTVDTETGKVRGYTMDDLPGKKYELRKGHTDLEISR